ncbi:MAG: hypothetical protein ACRC20_12770 [Segniliparus sp.]|uniref:hypothetical protein n=1 Tax=Segniliparus sp. TaxID=2804064 RepID=UPI003F3283FE
MGADETNTGIGAAAASTAMFVAVAGFCLLLLHNNLYFGSDFPIVLVSALLLIPAALFQLVRFLLRKPGLRSWRTVATPAAWLLTFLLLRIDAPSRLGWQISKEQFEAAAAELGRAPDKAPGFQRRLGLYQIREAAVDPESGAVYFLTPYGVLDSAAFVRLPHGAKTRESYVGACHRWDDDWKICTNELHGE